MNSQKAFKALLVSALLLAGGPVFAAKGFNYSFADVGYNYLDGDDFEMDSGQVDASFGTFKNLALRAGYTRGWTDDFPENKDPSGDPDVNEFRFGFQPHYSLFKPLDIFADLIYVNTKLNGDVSNTDIGYIYGAGIRYQAFKKVEFRLAGEYRSGSVDEAFVVLGPVVKLTKRLAVSLRTSHSSDSSDYFAGLRLNF